ncbi:MAG TPA: DUF222 domain-containing protein [Actinomycetota bacterium]|nr:DUF222 domain-containing protein [Actinomycetota bacterium]
MSELASAIEVFESEDLAGVHDEQLEEDLAQLHRAAERIELQRLRRLAEMDRRKPWLADGVLSSTSWVARRFRVSAGQAAADVRMARALEQMPGTRRAVAEGEITLAAAKMLAGARESDPEAFAEAEGLLVEAARIHSLSDLTQVVGYWRSACESKRLAQTGDDPLVERRRLHVSPTLFGMVRIDGDLDPETGESVLTALRSVVDAEVRSGEDSRTPAQRQADALGEICRGWLSRSDRPEVGGERPHVALVIRDSGAELDHVGPVTTRTARFIACDAAVSRIVVDARSEPLDVGRKSAVVPAAMRRAVIVRDRHCRFPGCDRPHSWCDAHHITHWADGGETKLENLILLCRRHHRLVHQGFRIGAGPTFLRPDGTTLEDRAPP